MRSTRLAGRLLVFALGAASAAGCGTTSYDLSGIDIPVRADRVLPPGTPTEPFLLRETSILWVHGLLGERVPDVAAILKSKASGHDAVVGFRVRYRARFHDWLVTHLTLSLVRMKTVEIAGELVR